MYLIKLLLFLGFVFNGAKALADWNRVEYSTQCSVKNQEVCSDLKISYVRETGELSYAGKTFVLQRWRQRRIENALDHLMPNIQKLKRSCRAGFLPGANYRQLVLRSEDGGVTQLFSEDTIGSCSLDYTDENGQIKGFGRLILDLMEAAKSGDGPKI